MVHEPDRPRPSSSSQAIRLDPQLPTSRQSSTSLASLCQGLAMSSPALAQGKDKRKTPGPYGARTLGWRGKTDTKERKASGEGRKAQHRKRADDSPESLGGTR